MKRKVVLSGMLAFCATAVQAQTAAERAEIIRQYDLPLLDSFAAQTARKAAADKAYAIEFARRNNLPVAVQNAGGSTDELIRIDEGGVPIYFTNKNVNAAISTRANYLAPGGGLGLNLTGQNITVGVWDGGGVRTTHQELTGRVTIGDNASASGNAHATHVGGTIAASGITPAARGMATGALIRSYDWNSDVSEMTTAAGDGLLMSNHSYGYVASNLPDWYFGAYISESVNWDNILFNAPYYTICKAAGNDGTSSENGSPLGGASNAYDKLSGAATAKNVIVVANANDASINASGALTSVSINSSSSQGPTDDLRIKPDITGNGTSVYSCVSSSNTAYGTMTGTSMASPNVAGTLTLVTNHYKNITGSYMLGAALRGLALHTADDAGSAGPDASFGWGLLNAKKMAETINNRNTTAMISDRSLPNGATDTVFVNSDGVTPMSVSISWYDRPGTAQTSSQLNNTAVKRLVNNLDLRVVASSNGTVYLPWVLTSRSTNAQADNNNDNFERADLGVVPAGQYAIAVSHKGSLTGGAQNYTLIVTGKANGTTATCNAPTNLVASAISVSSASLSWAASSSANQGYTVEYKASGSASWTTAYIGTSTSTTLSNLSAATVYNWRVKTDCSASLSSGYADATFTTSTPATGCDAPTNLTSTALTQNSATVGWTASASTNTGYTVEYKAGTSATWIVAGTAATTSRTLIGLAPSTQYDWRVLTVCSATSNSSYATGSFTTTSAPATGCAQAYENNNSLTSAYTISEGTDYQAAIGTSGDVDYYKITLPSGNYTVNLTNLSHDIDLRIQNAAGTTLATSQNGGTTSEQISATFSGGTYYFRVYPYSGFNANTCYTFNVKPGLGVNTLQEGAVNNVIDNMRPVALYPNPASGTVHVRIRVKGGEAAQIRVVDMMGRELLRRDAGNGENEINVTALAPGHYTVVVETGGERTSLPLIKR